MTRPLKIALYHNLPSGGAKRALYEWVRRLAHRHTIDVFTFSTADHEFCDIRPFVRKQYEVRFDFHRLFGSPLGRLNAFQRWRDLGDLARLDRHIAGQIHRGGYDLLFAQPGLYSFIPAVLQFARLPSIFYLHEPFGRQFVRPIRRPYLSTGWRERVNRFDPLIRLYESRLYQIQRRSVAQTTRLLANSEFTRRQILQEFGVDAPVCYLGVDFEGFRPLPGVEKEDFVLSVGELTPRKGFDFLVESLALIPADIRPPLKLVSNVADPAEQAYIEALARQKGVAVEVLSRLGFEELVKLYNRARLCVYSPVLEPFGLVPLEAMACGTPVVGVREGGVAETVVHEQAGLLTPRHPARFAAAVQRLLTDAGLAAAYGQNARQIVLDRWNWDTATEELERHLYAVAGISDSTPAHAAAGRPASSPPSSSPFIISVIINFRRKEDTLACLASLAENEQTYPRHKAIVLDIASDDGSVEAIRAAFPAVEVMELEENRGYAGNNNIGIRAALAQGADWIFILNEDTVLAPDCLAQMAAVAVSDPRAGVVGPMVYHFDEPEVIQSAGGRMDSLWQSFHIGQNEPDRGQFPAPRQVDWISGCAIMVRREMVEQVGGLDERFFTYWEETEWCWRARQKGWRVLHAPAARLWHKGVRRDYRPGPAVTYYYTRNHLLLLAKHRAPLRAWLFTAGQIGRTLLSWSLKPRWRPMRPHRNAMWRGTVDFLRHRWGERKFEW